MRLFPTLLRLLLLLAVGTSLPLCVAAQTDVDFDEMLQELVERETESDAWTDDGGQQERWEELAEMLSTLHDNPLPLNAARRADLLALPFMDSHQVDAIIDYRARFGRIDSWNELKGIKGISLDALRWLPLVCTLDAGGTAAARNYARLDTVGHAVVARVDVPMYERDGWPWAQGIAQRLRYSGQYGRRAEWGLRASKDAGEPMFTSHMPLWDAYGGHVTLRNWRFVRTLVLGDYKAGFGEGLVMNNGLMLGKATLGWNRTTTGVRPHRSNSEYSFLRGAAAVIGLSSQLQLAALYSYRQLDASLYNDGTVRSINASGLHRTESEQERRHNLTAHTTALHLQWQHSSYGLGLTGMYQYYNRVFSRSSSAYRQIAPQGYQFGAVSMDYSYRLSPLLVAGETAHSLQQDGNAWATLNRISYQLGNALQLSALQRFYSKYYYSALATAYSENSSVQNESGVALQADAELTSQLSLLAMADIFYSPWPRYSMSRSSQGWEATLQTAYKLNRHSTLTVRYALKSKEQSDRRHYSHRIRTTYNYRASSHLTLIPAVQWHAYRLPAALAKGTAYAASTSTGIALLPRADYTLLHERLRLSLLAAWFHTDDWNSRLHVYEPSLYQGFGLQQLYGRGQRLAATVRYQSATGRWYLQAKLGMTHYDDRTEQSSGPTRIGSAYKADAQLLLRVRW